MALGTPTVLAAASTTASTLQSKVSGTFTPTAGALVFVVVTTSGGATTTSDLTTSDISPSTSGWGAWSLAQATSGVASSTACYVFYAKAPASPASGTVTVTLGGTPAEAKIGVYEQTGQDDTTPVVGEVTLEHSTSATPTLTLGATPGTDDYVWGFLCSRNDSNGSTPGTGFTELADVFNANPSATQSIEYRTGTTATTVDWSGANTVSNSAVGLIVKPGVAETPKSLSDTATGTDAIAVSVPKSLSDTGTGADTVGNVSVALPLADARTVTDSVTATVTLAFSDARTVTDTVAAAATVALSDTASGADNAAVAASLAVTDVGASADDLTVEQSGGSASKSLSDTGTGADALTGTANAILADLAPAADALTVSVAVTVADAAAAADGATISAATTFSDARTVTDALAVAVPVPLSDPSAAADAVTVARSGIGGADTSTGADSLGVAVAAVLAEAASVVDSLDVLNLAETSVGQMSERALAGARITERAVPGSTMTAGPVTDTGPTMKET